MAHLGEMGYRIPFTVRTLEPFAIPEKSSTGPMNHLIVEMGHGLAGASNGYAAVTVPLEPVYLETKDLLDRWPANALTAREVPVSLSIPWSALERAEHAAQSMPFPPDGCYLVRGAGDDVGGAAFALLVREHPPTVTPSITIDLPDTPRARPFLSDPILHPDDDPGVHLRFNAKFFTNIAGITKKMSVDEVYLTAERDGSGTVRLIGTQNTGRRYLAAMLPSVLTERLFEDDEQTEQATFNFDDTDVVDAEYTEADREGADPRADRAMGSGMIAIEEGDASTDTLETDQDGDA